MFYFDDVLAECAIVLQLYGTHTVCLPMAHSNLLHMAQVIDIRRNAVDIGALDDVAAGEPDTGRTHDASDLSDFIPPPGESEYMQKPTKGPTNKDVDKRERHESTIKKAESGAHRDGFQASKARSQEKAPTREHSESILTGQTMEDVREAQLAAAALLEGKVVRPQICTHLP
jgi:hypothetical protein